MTASVEYPPVTKAILGFMKWLENFQQINELSAKVGKLGPGCGLKEESGEKGPGIQGSACGETIKEIQVCHGCQCPASRDD